MKFKSVDPADLKIPELHSYLLAAVAPRPIALASTIDSNGNLNLSPFSFFNAFSANPPILVFSPARRGRDNTTKDTYDNIKEIPEVVINVVSYSMVEQVSLSSTEYPSSVNEFLKAGFQEVASQKVRPPRVGESPVAFECMVEEVKELGDQGNAGNLVICRVVLIHINEQYLDPNHRLDTTKLDLVGRMGANWYARASGEALFEIAKPGKAKGIGVDQLPQNVRNSKVLTGNDLGRLGNLNRIPDPDDIFALLRNRETKVLWEQFEKSPDAVTELHRLAQKWINRNEVERALKLLLLPEIRI